MERRFQNKTINIGDSTVAEEKNQNNVADFKVIKGNKKNSPKPLLEYGKIPKADLYNEMMNIINRRWKMPNVPDFHVRYFVCKEERGDKSIIRQVKDYEVRYADVKHVADDISKYCYKIGEDHPRFKWTTRDTIEAAKQWFAITPEIEKPAMISFLDDNKFAFRYIDWDIEQDGPTPKLDEIMSRASDARALMLFIGSLFFEDSYAQQYLWLFGDGGQGKSTLISVIKEILQDAVQYSDVPKGDGATRFFKKNLCGRRVLLFDDCESNGFLASPGFKTITGSRYIFVEGKGAQGFEHKHNAKFIFVSNEAPDISGEMADRRRIIACKIKNRGSSDVQEGYEADIIKNEARFFIGRCIRYFRDEQARSLPISCDQSIVEDVIEENEEWAIAFFEEHFNLKHDAYFKVTDFFKYCQPYLKLHTSKDKKIVLLKKILKRRYGVDFGVGKYINGKKTKCVTGFTIKNPQGQIILHYD